MMLEHYVFIDTAEMPQLPNKYSIVLEGIHEHRYHVRMNSRCLSGANIDVLRLGDCIVEINCGGMITIRRGSEVIDTIRTTSTHHTIEAILRTNVATAPLELAISSGNLLRRYQLGIGSPPWTIECYSNEPRIYYEVIEVWGYSYEYTRTILPSWTRYSILADLDQRPLYVYLARDVVVSDGANTYTLPGWLYDLKITRTGILYRRETGSEEKMNVYLGRFIVVDGVFAILLEHGVVQPYALIQEALGFCPKPEPCPPCPEYTPNHHSVPPESAEIQQAQVDPLTWLNNTINDMTPALITLHSVLKILYLVSQRGV